MTALEKWKNDFKEFISELSMPRDDYKGILAYIDEVPNEASEQQPCEDCISRQAVLDINENHHGQMPNHVNHEIWNEIKALPSVTPKEKTGKWIFDEILDRHYYCSECKSMGVDYWDYCPECGARMVEPQESEGNE